MSFPFHTVSNLFATSHGSDFPQNVAFRKWHPFTSGKSIGWWNIIPFGQNSWLYWYWRIWSIAPTCTALVDFWASRNPKKTQTFLVFLHQNSLDMALVPWRVSKVGLWTPKNLGADEPLLGLKARQASSTVSNARKDTELVLHPRNLTWQWKTTIWRCISYWTWGISNVMLVFRGVSALANQHENQIPHCSRNWKGSNQKVASQTWQMTWS